MPFQKKRRANLDNERRTFSSTTFFDGHRFLRSSIHLASASGVSSEIPVPSMTDLRASRLSVQLLFLADAPTSPREHMAKKGNTPAHPSIGFRLPFQGFGSLPGAKMRWRSSSCSRTALREPVNVQSSLQHRTSSGPRCC